MKKRLVLLIVRGCAGIKFAKLAQDFCRQVVRKNRSNASAFQGFFVPLGGKKTSQDVKFISAQLLICCICLFGFTACSSSDVDEFPEQALINEIEYLTADDVDTALVEAFTLFSAGYYEDAVTAFNNAKSHFDVPNIMLEIGLGKAYFYLADYERAKQAFEAALAIDPDRDDVLRYLGEVYLRTGDYANAAMMYLYIFRKNRDDDIIFGKLEQSLRRIQDYDGLLLIYEELIESADTDDEVTVNVAAGKLIEVALLRQDYDLIESLIERFNDFDIAPAMELGFEAYLLLLQDDIEAIEELLFDHANNEVINTPYSVYFGQFNEFGEYEGLGITIGSNRVYFGEFKSGDHNGVGKGFTASTRVWYGQVIQLTQNETRLIEADWKEGAPEGNVIIISEYFRYEGDALFHYWRGVKHITIVNGLAQGELWEEEHYENIGRQQRPVVTYIKHFMEDGRSVPFEVTTGRGLAVMAYKAWFENPQRRATSTREARCFCNFVIDW